METQGADLNLKAMGSEIKRLRKAKGEAIGGKYTQEDLCRDMGIYFDAPLNVKTLSKFETGRQEPTLTQAVQMSFLLCEGCSWKETLATIAIAGISGDPIRRDAGAASPEYLDAMSQYLGDWIELEELVFELQGTAHTEGILDAISDEDRQFILEMGIFSDQRSSRDVSEDIFSWLRKRSPIPSESIFKRIAKDHETANKLIDAVGHARPPQGAVAIGEPEGKEKHDEQD